MKSKNLLLATIALGVFSACVPTKKYNELAEKEKACNEELAKYKSAAIDFESKFKDCDTRLGLLNAEVDQMKKDTARIGDELRLVQTQYDKMVNQVVAYEKQIDDIRSKGQAETSTLQGELSSKSDELRRKQELLQELENELKQKQQLLADRERRVYELEEIINRKDKAINDLKNRVVSALKPYEDKGLSVVEKNGKLYVSLEAKLLFKTASTKVEEEGKQALIDLAKILESEKDMEIVVEGHTDTDKMVSPNHPKNNWELSVLRATSVVEIMLSNSKMDPKILSAAGRSEFFPTDAMDKSKNRRIEIIVAPDLKALFELISK